MKRVPRTAHHDGRDRRVHSSGMGAWFDHHLYSFVASLGRLFRKPWATLLTIGVMAVALALPLGLWLVLGNVSASPAKCRGSRQIAVFLKPGPRVARERDRPTNCAGAREVASVEVRTPEQGLQTLRERDGLGDAIDALAATGERIRCRAAARRAARRRPESRRVAAHNCPKPNSCSTTRCGASAWTTGCVSAGAWRSCSRRCSGSARCSSSATRCAWTSNRAAKKSACCNCSAPPTVSFAARSCISASWYGLAAGALALALLTAAWIALRAPLAELAGSYGSGFALQGVDAMQAAIVIGGATLLGWIGAGVVTGHFLRQTRPTR